MCLLAFIIINLIVLTSAKLIRSDSQINDLYDDIDSDKIHLSFNNSEKRQKIWVLDLNDEGLDTLKLREGTDEENEDFTFYILPLIESYKKEHSAVVKRNRPKPEANANVKVDANKTSAMRDIIKYLNKFALYSKTDSDSYLKDSHENDDPRITLQFMGQNTALIVTFGIRQWHYFIAPPSPFPSWFYEFHHNSQVKIVEVPRQVQDRFYPALFRLLQVVLRYPV